MADDAGPSPLGKLLGWWTWLLALATVLTRWPLRTTLPVDHDTVNFVLAMERFDIRVHQPHPPGYVLTIAVGKALRALVGDANTALVLMSLAGSVLLVIGIERLGRELFSPRVGRFAAALALVSPLVWFEGLMGLTYALEAGLAVLAGLLAWRVAAGRPRVLIALAALIALAGGFRQSSALFLLPLAIWAGRSGRRPRAEWLAATAVFGAIAAAWFGAMVAWTGGPAAYLDAFGSNWSGVVWRRSLIEGGLEQVFHNAFGVLAALGLLLGVALPLAFFAPERLAAARRGFFLAWILPALAFHVLVFFQLVNAGYLMGIAAPLLLLCARSLDGSPSRVRIAMGVAAVVVNVGLAWQLPFQTPRGALEKQRELERHVAAMKATLQPERDVVVAFDAHYSGWRHAIALLPEVKVIAYPPIEVAGRWRVFTGFGGDTERVETVPFDARWQRIVFFPLPAGQEPYYEQKLGATIGKVDAEIAAGEVRLHTAPADSLGWIVPIGGAAAPPLPALPR